jgi:type VII secretion-associated protein (TIGR03931 family)
VRLAVELGRERVRLARADGPGGPPRVLPDRPGPAADAVRAQTRRPVSAADRLESLVVVYPTRWTPRAARTASTRLAVPGVSTRACPRALAAAREALAREAQPPGPLGVVEIGRAGTVATVLSLPRLGSWTTAATAVDAGEVLARRHVPRAGADQVTRALADAAAAAGTEPVALTGGVLLLAAQRDVARLLGPLTDLVGEPPLVPNDPDDLALLGALRPLPTPDQGETGSPWPDPGQAGSRSPEPGPGPAGVGGQPIGSLPGGWLLAPPVGGGRARAALTGLAVSLTAAAVTAWGGAAFDAGAPLGPSTGRQPQVAPPGEGPVGGGRAGSAAGASPDEPGVLLAQYDYVLRVPEGWRHSGGLPERRRTLLSPVDMPRSSALIAVEQTPLGYDSSAEPGRALRELHTRHEQAVAAGAPLTDLTGTVAAGDRRAITYRQHQLGLDADVDWYVLFERDTQLSVGCQHTAAGAVAVRAACEHVLRTLRLH